MTDHAALSAPVGQPDLEWLAALEALANRVAHDFRNALNGVAVNLEVVRGRSARGADAAAIAPFAAAAAAQFESAAGAAEALLELARPGGAAADVGAIVTRIGRLVGIRGDSVVTVRADTAGEAIAAAPVSLVRALVARSVLSALDAGAPISCAIRVDDDIFLHIVAAGSLPVPDPGLLAAATSHSITVTVHDGALDLRFPARDSRATHAPA